ncbi:MAG TPA: hypothetical protein VHZ73_09090 [Vicinamibacterales bacterium]|jgi:hypothetical protein|nr:hypothetical protein [Vicinamibacterales bacterium]
MRTVFLVLAALLVAGVAQAQPNSNLPVSLDRIREGLAKPAPTLTRSLDAPSTYQTGIQLKTQEMKLKPDDLKGGPVPAGGPVMFEQLRIMHDPTNHPLMQPYAAFTGGELLTLTSEALARRYIEDHTKDLTSK